MTDYLYLFVRETMKRSDCKGAARDYTKAVGILFRPD